MLTEKQRRKKKNQFLKKHIFHDLKNLNDGFDTESIFYFSASDFEIVLQRIKQFRIKVYGIEPWLNGTFYDVKAYEDYDLMPDDPNWYMQAFDEFRRQHSHLQFAATYDVPEELLIKMT